MMPITIYEVGPRDGLQNCEFSLSTDEKVNMIETLHRAGLKNIEITSFVHPKWVPNLADAENVVKRTKHLGEFAGLIGQRILGRINLMCVFLLQANLM